MTLDDDIAGILQEKARQPGSSLKAVVNELLRAGLAASDGSAPTRAQVRVVGKPLRLRPGYDPDKLNQLVDELEVEEFQGKHRAR